MTAAETPTPTQQLAAWVARQTASELPADVLALASDCLLDHIAVSLYGMRQPWTEFVAQQVRHERGVQEASIYGEALKVPMRAAALVNGSAAHAFELDDWHAASLSHVSACVIPAVLAVAEQHRLPGLRALVAIVAGYEVMARVGQSTIPELIIRGFHPSGTHGPIGAAAAVANLLQLSPQQTTWAMGIAASCASGLMEFSQDPQGTMVKRFHTGRAAEAGVLAALLAQKGMTAPKAALDGKFGYARAFSNAPRPEYLTRALGEDFQIRYTNVKPYACCGALHAGIDAVEQLVAQHGIKPEVIREIVFGGNDSHLQRHASADPDSVMAAQYSMPYAAAVAIEGRALDPRLFDEGSYRDPHLLALASRVRVELHPEVVRVYPTMLGGYIRIVLEDGRAFDKLILVAKGTAAQPLGRDGILAKATALCEPLTTAVERKELFDLILEFDQAKDAGTLGAAMARATSRMSTAA
jgi:2-methylcitrate dehydratase PrpD